MKRAPVVVLVVVLALVVLGAAGFVRHAKERNRRNMATWAAFSRFHGALLKRDYARMHAEASPAFRAAISEKDLAAKLEAFQKAEGAATGGFWINFGTDFDVSLTDFHYRDKLQSSLDFEQHKGLPVFLDVEPDGELMRPTRIMLYGQGEPLKLGVADEPTEK